MANVGSFTSSTFEGLDYNPVGTPASPDWNDKLSGTTRLDGVLTSARVVVMTIGDNYLASTFSTALGAWSFTNLPQKQVDGKPVTVIAYYATGSAQIFDKITTVA